MAEMKSFLHKITAVINVLWSTIYPNGRYLNYEYDLCILVRFNAVAFVFRQ
jgi:hypothetical protein